MSAERCGPRAAPTALDMSTLVRHRARQRASPALIAALCLACAGSAVAAKPSSPSAEPLWQAFPLDAGKSTSTARPPAQHTSARPARSMPLDLPAPRVAPPAVVILFYAAIGIGAVCVARLALQHVRRRRSRAPVTCEISWAPGGHGGAFRATAFDTEDKPRLVAESRRFERQPPPLPDEDAASRDAYVELVRNLVSEGWEPYERGREWWALSLRRNPPAPPRAGAIRG